MRTPSARNGRRTRRGTAAPAPARTRAEAAGGDTFDLAELLTVLTAVRKGDFSARMGVNRTGIAGKVADTLNDIIELNQEMARELDRVSIVVGKEGRITQRARLAGAGGAWAASIDSVNGLIVDLVQPTSEVSRVIGAVAKGDLSQTMALDFEGRPLMGEFLRIGRTVNSMVDQLSSFASEVTRVAREVGTEGKLGGQARVKGVAGTWKDLTDNVNSMAGNLTAQVRNIAEVTTAVARGELNKKITVDVKGEILELKNTINTMVDQLNSFASEVTRVAREVGTEGKLGGQAQVRGVGGTWKDLTDSVNSMAGNLTAQVRNIAEVTTAVANGDLSKKITVDVKGEILELKNTINTMVDQLNSFASEVTRVAREVGTEGKLGGQAQVRGVGGTWKDLTDNVNSMAGNLTAQVRNIAEVTTAVANGDLSKKITVDVQGRDPGAQEHHQHDGGPAQLVRIRSDPRGARGGHRGQAGRPGPGDGRRRDLEGPHRQRELDGGQPHGAGPQHRRSDDRGGDRRPVQEDHGGRAGRDSRAQEHHQHHGGPAELVRLRGDPGGARGRHRREAGRSGARSRGGRHLEGPHGQRELDGRQPDVAGPQHRRSDDRRRPWRAQQEDHRGRAGEILELKNTINTMVDQLSSFASEVTRVAREVGTEGKLGGQAQVTGVGRHLEGPDGQRELDGRQPDGAGA